MKSYAVGADMHRRIMDVFVAMRCTLASLAPLLSRIETTELRQLRLEDAQARNEERFKLILDAMQDKRFPPLSISNVGGGMIELEDRIVRFVARCIKVCAVLSAKFSPPV